MSVQSGAKRGVAEWVIDPVHSDAVFAVRHMMVTNVKGRFNEVEGAIAFDEADPTSASITVTINAASIDTRNEDRDTHLRSADFLDVESYPAITFVSRDVKPLGGDRYQVTGDLTIRGTTREVVLDATYEGTNPDPWGNVRAGFSATTTVNRHDFGLNWNAALEAGGVMLGETVKITLDVQAIKQT